jgi:hypothetical protein
MANALKLLLVDDDALDRLAVKRALAHAGVEAQIEEQAGRGPALQAYALIRKVRSLPDERRNIPAAALTAFANATDRARTLLADYQAHVPKPVEPSELGVVVASLAGRTNRPALDN